jgi:hypothetical protein
MMSRLDAVFWAMAVSLAVGLFAEMHIRLSRPILEKHPRALFANNVLVVVLLALLVSSE